ncbi:type II toxin-antitoxin system HicB family antitoxin [Candidatus Poribacteria bacterium]|nr:type II toxin-antitoxin system HicB family antitoxin [Candidatus Poribacteria bacterium]
MKNYRFTIIVEQDQEGYFVSCPELQGCYTQGDTYEEALENIRDAIKLHLDDRLSAHEQVQNARSVSLATIEVAM